MPEGYPRLPAGLSRSNERRLQMTGNPRFGTHSLYLFACIALEWKFALLHRYSAKPQ